jgi:hypothetical protein
MRPIRQSLLLSLALASAAKTAPLAHYAYDPATRTISEAVSGARIAPTGSFLSASGPAGPAIRLDGDSTEISGKAIPRLTDGGPWTLSAWVKLDALPWNDAPILDQRTTGGSLFFGFDPYGHLAVQRRGTGSAPQKLISSVAVAPRTWARVAVSYRDGKLALFVNGKAVAAQAAEPEREVAGGSRAEVLIGRVRTPVLPYPKQAIHPWLPVLFSLEGSIGEIAIDDHALSPSELTAPLRGIAAAQLAQGPAAQLPRWRGGPGPFGAFHTTLAYDPSWDAPRRVAADSDVVVRFPQAPIQLVFWQGANYIPAWVTENGRWYSDEFMEIYGKPRCPDGEDCEPMSDKQVRYSHVEILESTPARAVVHWRYALSEVENGKIADAPDPSQWGAWADEYWTVYPDGSAVRRQVLWTDNPDREASEFQESIIIMPAGQRPEDNLHLDALSLANLKGESKSYNWLARSATGLAKPRGPDHFTGLDDPMIQWINLKSDWKPFQVVNAGPAKFEGINWEPSMSSFEWWNHWPVAQIRSSGHPALTDDRPSHTSLSHIYWPIWRKDEKTISRLLLTGLTTGSASSLAPLARSWTAPPTARADGTEVGYDPAQRAYTLAARADRAPISLAIEASADKPLVNPAFVVRGWSGGASVRVDGAQAGRAQIGHVERLDGSSMVIFVPLTATAPVHVTIIPAASG